MNTVTVFLFVFGGAGFVVFLVMIIRRVSNPRKFLELEKLIESGNTKAAIRYAKAVLGRNERSPEAHWYLGECYLTEDRSDLATVEYKYITNYGKYTNTATEKKVRSRLANTYLKLGQLD